MEIKPIKGFENHYSICCDGRVISISRKVKNSKGISQTVNQKVLKPQRKGNYVRLYMNGERTSFKVSNLVANHFIPNPLGKTKVINKDGNESNNEYKNLEWK